MLPCKLPQKLIDQIDKTVAEKDSGSSQIRHFEASPEIVAPLWCKAAHHYAKEVLVRGEDNKPAYLEIHPEEPAPPQDGLIRPWVEHPGVMMLHICWGGSWYEVTPNPGIDGIKPVFLF